DSPSSRAMSFIVTAIFTIMYPARKMETRPPGLAESCRHVEVRSIGSPGAHLVERHEGPHSGANTLLAGCSARRNSSGFSAADHPTGESGSREIRACFRV